MSTEASYVAIEAEQNHLTAYHAKYFAHELTKRCSSNTVEKLTSSLQDAQVDLNPHQVDAALFAFQSPLSKGAILADEVGLGKTIEAGIVISQKWAESKRKILIIAPANLRSQWSQELLEKFFISSVILEAKSFNQEIQKGNLNPFVQNDVVLCSYQFVKTKEPYVRQVAWDLVVIDEAHRLRNVYKPNNKIANAVKRAVDHAPKILLTATPLQNSLLELYGLVSLIDDHTFGDIQSFKSQFARLTDNENYDDLKERLKPICQRTLRRQVLEYVPYTNRSTITQEFEPREDEQKLYDLVTEYLRSERLFALPSGQRTLMTLILRKLLASSTYAISGTLDSLAKKLEGFVQKHENQNTPDLETQIAEDFETYDELKDEWDDEGEEQKEEKVFTEEEIRVINQESARLRQFQALAESIQKNSKGEVLLAALESGFSRAKQGGASKKAIIFTESTRTQNYLKRVLEETQYKGKIVLFNGSNSDPESKEIYNQWLEIHKNTDRVTGSRTADVRTALVDYFREEAVIMIATEAAAEGINLQFCSLVINYDLPWNPQRIEQRIGRCHRYGQKYDVVVVNFLNKKNAADQRVYELLEQKFKLFSGVFGASDEVLGTIESGVDFEKRISKIYQDCRTEVQIKLAFDELQQEMEAQIDEKIGHARQKLLENFDEEVNEKLRIRKLESQNYLGKYEEWLWLMTKFYLQKDAHFNHKEGSFYLVNNPFPEEKIHPGPYRIGKHIEDANIYRIGHPLARRIIENCKKIELESTELIFDYSNTPKKITALEDMVGQSGWLDAISLTIQSFEPEDHVILSGISDDGTVLTKDQCQRLFSLPADASPLTEELGEAFLTALNERYHRLEATLIEENLSRNSCFFDEEMAKLDKWAEDLKSSLELELKELDKNIKAQKTEAKKLLKLEDKVKVQRDIKEMEKKRNTMRLKLYEAQDSVDEQKDNLISNIEARLKQQMIKTDLFRIRWKVV